MATAPAARPTIVPGAFGIGGAPAPASKSIAVRVIDWIVAHPWQSASVALAIVTLMQYRRLKSDQAELADCLISVERARLDAMRRAGIA